MSGGKSRARKLAVPKGREHVLLSRVLMLCAFTTAAVTVGFSCSSSTDDAKAKNDAGTDAYGMFEVGDGANFCGNESLQVVTHPPLLYFVVDSSGSMSSLYGKKTRYELLFETSVDLVATLGASIRVGAAVFPNQKNNDTCATGAEVMAPQLGGTLTTNKFTAAINVNPFGGTPTAATLEALAPKFANASSDPGSEAILLVTDGAPNCNLTTTCTAADCQPNIDGQCPIQNCCDTSAGGTPGNCNDRQATLKAISDVVKGGAKVYVIGLTVGAAYEDTLEQMALVGGAAQSGAPFYYRVDDLNGLEGTFQTIASSLISCQFNLQDPPANPELTNVYIDGTELAQDPVNGWVWVGTDHAEVKLSGDACNSLKSGNAQDIRVLTGCPTLMPN